MNELLRDVRYAVRQWGRRPGFALVVVLTLALGIGANAAVFSVFDTVLLSPLPYQQPERLVFIHSRFASLDLERFWISPPEFVELREWNRSFEEIGAYRVRSVNVSGGERPERVTSADVSAGLFEVLGVPAAVGRPFTEDEDLPNADPVVVLSWDLWQRSFDGDPSLVGKTIEVDGGRRTVVGVMPETFDVEDSQVELYLPLALDPADPGGRGSHGLFLIGRLAPGVTFAEAEQEMKTLLVRWQEEFGQVSHAPNPDTHPLLLVPLQEDLVGGARPALWLLLGAVGFVLLIACANAANVLLARAEGRQREVAVRTALGASGPRLLRQFLTESVALALAGGALGLLLAYAGLKAILATLPEGVPRLAEVGLDGRVLLFTLAAAVGTGLLFGLAPAFHARTRGLSGVLKEGTRSSAGAGRQRLRRALVVAEVALAAVLVVGAGLLLKSFWTLQQVDPGFDPEGVLSLRVSLPSATYPDEIQVAAFFDRLTAELEALPGVEVAAAMTGRPPARSINANDTEFEGVAQGPDLPIQNVDYYQFVTPGYFEALRIEPVTGRVFSETDAGDGAPVVVVNRRLAERFYPGQDPVGRRLRRGWFGDEEPWMTIVGVVEDVKQGGMDQEAGTELYFLHRQVPHVVPDAGIPRTLYAVVRTTGDPQALAGSAREVVARLDRSLPVSEVSPLAEVVGDSLARSRFLTLLVGGFGVLALLLAAVGTYGVLSYAVEERRHEMGVRMALGARAADLLKLVLSQGMSWVGAGLALGLLLAVALRRAVAGVLYGVTPGDPATFVTVVAVLLATALLACLVPAVRAVRVAPASVLKSE